MLDIILAVAVGVTAVLGLLFGIWYGKRSTKTELTPQLDRIAPLEQDNARLEALVQNERDTISQFKVDLARVEERESAQKEKYEQMKSDLDTAFGDIASKALRDNNQSFLELAKEKLGGQNEEAKQTLAAKELAIKNMLQPLELSLKALDEKTQAIEVARAGAYGGLEQLVSDIKTAIPASLDGLRRETAQLISALRSPKSRGNWGELQLRRCVEYAGMVRYCSFNEQVSTRNDDEKLMQPDMVIKMPNGRQIVVDSKTPLDAFLDSGTEGEAHSQTVRFAAHAQRVRAHLKDLSGKAYWNQFQPAPEFVICFLPSEALFSAALEAEPSLIEYSPNAKVIMATPTTLIALLKAVAYGWQQSEVTQSAEAIKKAGKDLYSKLVNAHEHLAKVGSSLGAAMSNYNKLIGSVEGRGGVFYQARTLGNLVHSDDEIEQLPVVPSEQRLLAADDWVRGPGLALAAEMEDA